MSREQSCCFEFRQTLGQLFCIALTRAALFLNFPHVLRQLGYSAPKMLGRLPQRDKIFSRGGKSPPSRDEFDAPILFLTFAPAYEQHSRLTCTRQMSAAAGLAVKSVDVDDAQSAFAVDFFTNALRGEFFGSSVAHCNGTVVEDNFVHPTFGFFELPWRDGRRNKVDGGNAASQMERNSLEFEELDERGGEHVLSRVLLHVIEAARPVDCAVNRARSDGLVGEMRDFAILGVEHFHDCGSAQVACVKWLSARSGVKRGAIQAHAPTRSLRFASEDLRVEFVQKRIVVIQPFNHCIL